MHAEPTRVSIYYGQRQRREDKDKCSPRRCSWRRTMRCQSARSCMDTLLEVLAAFAAERLGIATRFSPQEGGGRKNRRRRTNRRTCNGARSSRALARFRTAQAICIAPARSVLHWKPLQKRLSSAASTSAVSGSGRGGCLCFSSRSPPRVRKMCSFPWRSCPDASWRPASEKNPNLLHSRKVPYRAAVGSSRERETFFHGVDRHGGRLAGARHTRLRSLSCASTGGLAAPRTPR